jgi:hypothetical protein
MLAWSAAAPVLAQELTCEEFTEMEQAEQIEAMSDMAETMQGGATPPGADAMAPAADAAAGGGPGSTPEELAAAAAQACEVNPAATVAEAMEAVAQ